MVPDETPLNRRRFATALAAALTLPASGCLGDDDDESGNGNDDGADDGNESNGDGNESDGADGTNGDDGGDGNGSDGGDDDTLFDATILWVTALDEETGDPASGVSVTVTNGDYEAESETSSTGRAFFRDLEPGEYDVTAETDAGSAETTVELEEGDDGETELEVPIPEEDEDE